MPAVIMLKTIFFMMIPNVGWDLMFVGLSLKYITVGSGSLVK